MNRLFRIAMNMIFVLLLGMGMLASTLAQNSMPGNNSDRTAPSYDMKAQSLVDLKAVQDKFVDLANAIPSNKFTWRPSPDARSFAEVLLHVAGERYSILALMGAAIPGGIDAHVLEKSTTDPAKVVQELNRSWEFAQRTINEMNNSDFAKPLPKLGPDANAGDVVYILVADAHEHLGQVVAYARENGVIPPWTLKAQKQAAEHKEHK